MRRSVPHPKRGRRTIPAVLLAGVLLLLAHGSAFGEVALFVNAGDVNMRDGPGTTTTTVIATLSRGDEMRVRGQEGQWREVWSPRTRKTGWVAHWLLAEAPPEGIRREVAAVDCDELRLRTGPGQSHDVRATLERDTVLDVIAYEGQWRKVRAPGTATVGWVAAWLLRSSAPQATTSTEAAQGTRYVNTNHLYLRSGPGQTNQAFAILHVGTPLEMLEVNDPWIRVRVAGGYVGWVHRDYLTNSSLASEAGGVDILDSDQMRQAFDPEMEAALQGLSWNQAYVTGDSSNVRSGPGSHYSVVTTASRGTVFTVVGSHAGWVKGLYASGEEGWLAGWLCIAIEQPKAIAASDVPAAPDVPSAGPEAETGRQIAQKALTMLGTPYVYGGSSPGSGFDCSGLTYWAHKQLGITTARSSYGMWDSGTAVDRERLLPGDVVCFRLSSRGPGHVGIYIGDGNFVHSPQSGEVVRTQTLASRSRDFCGARRFW